MTNIILGSPVNIDSDKMRDNYLRVVAARAVFTLRKIRKMLKTGNIDWGHDDMLSLSNNLEPLILEMGNPKKEVYNFIHKVNRMMVDNHTSDLLLIDDMIDRIIVKFL